MRPYALLTALLLGTSLLAQAPEAFNYQGVARDAGGDALANTSVGVQFQLHQGTAVGTVVYSETHSPTTNELGLFSLEVGNGTPGTGNFAAIDWSAGPYFLEVGLDPAGGSSYTSVGTQHLLSVPFALHARTADMVDDGDWVQSGDTLHSDGKRVGIGTSAPSRDLDVEGTFQLKDGSQGDKRILTSDADGNASWQELNATALFGAGNVPVTGLSCLAEVASVPTGDYPYDIEVSGNYAYVANVMDGSIGIYDISNPSAPVQVGSIAGDFPEFVAVSGNYLYISEVIGFRVYDISDPSSPIPGTIVPESLSDAAVSGTHLYGTDLFNDELLVFDLSNPASPNLIGSVGAGVRPLLVEVSGDHAYVMDGTFNNTIDSLRVFDVSNPSAPSEIASIATGGFSNLTVSGDHVYVVNRSNDNMMVFDMIVPAFPNLIATVPTGNQPRAVAVSANYACVVSEDGNMMVFDITTPSAPLLSATIAVGYVPSDVEVDGSHAYVVNLGDNSMTVFELFCPAQQVTYDPATGTFGSVPPVWQQDGDTLFTLDRKVGIGTDTPEQVIGNTDLAIVDDTGTAARLGLSSNGVKGVLDVRSAMNNQRMQLGSISAHPLGFFTSGSLQMTLDTNGFLGIGTETPTHGLEIRANGPAFGHRSADSTIAIGTYVNNTFGAFIQTHTNHPLQFATNNGDAQMTLMQNGNVGIGTSAPLTKLHVAGTSAGLRLQDTDDGSVLSLVAPDPTGGASGGVGTVGAFDLPLFTNNVDRMTIKADGKVGIGTDAPSALLDVRGNARIGPADGVTDATLTITTGANTGSGKSTLSFLAAGNGCFSNAAIELAKDPLAGQSASRLNFLVRDQNCGSLSQRMTIRYNGNVGIGTSDPTARLHSGINAPSGASILQRTGLFLDNQDQSGTFPNSPNEVALVFGENGIPKQAIVGATYANDHMRFYTGADFTNSRIAIATSGNVGVGTDAPTAKLSVNGNANNSTGSWGVFSDARIKTVQREFTDGLSVIDRMRPVVFTYNAEAPFEAEGEQVGIIAQELEELAPYMVSITEHGDIDDLREVNNQAYVFLLINAVKELSAKVDELQAENAGLRDSDADLRAQLTANSQLLADVQRLLDAQTSR